MRIVIQRVTEASVTIDGQLHSTIGPGMMVLVGVREGDTLDDMRWLAQKTVNLRIFDDEQGVMNRSIIDAGGEVLAVSQFTLNASTKKGNRPSYIHAAGHDVAVTHQERRIRRRDAGRPHQRRPRHHYHRQPPQGVVRLWMPMPSRCGCPPKL